MTAERDVIERDLPLDPAWLNDRSEFQMSFVHGLKNPVGLKIQYELEGRVVRGRWLPGEEHVGFPGFVHGGLLSAVLDDAMGRYAALYRRWAVTGRLDVRYRQPAKLHEELVIVAEVGRVQKRAYHAESRLEREGSVIAQASGLYMFLSGDMAEKSVAAWPKFRDYLPEEAP